MTFKLLQLSGDPTEIKLFRDLRLSTEMMELTTSPTVNAVCFLSLVSFFLMRYQSNTKTIQDKIFIPQQTPTYLKIKENEDLSLWF